jgi:hypothetical protein
VQAGGKEREDLQMTGLVFTNISTSTMIRIGVWEEKKNVRYKQTKQEKPFFFRHGYTKYKELPSSVFNYISHKVQVSISKLFNLHYLIEFSFAILNQFLKQFSHSNLVIGLRCIQIYNKSSQEI